MIRALCLGVCAAITAPLLAAQEAASAQPKPDVPAKAESAAPTDASRWEALQKQLKEIRDELGVLRSRSDVGEKALAIELDIFKERLGRLEKSVKELSSLRDQTPPSRTSSYFTPSTPPATGTIRLDNRTDVESTVILAGRSYTLPARSSLVLAGQPVGNFTYEVLAEGFGLIRAATTRALASGETFAIAINP